MRHKHRNTHKNSGTEDKKKKNEEETDMVNFARPWSYSKKRQKLGTMRNFLFFQASCPPVPDPILTPSQGKVSFLFNCFSLTAFPSITRDRDANQLLSQVILMRERFQKDYEQDFKCLLKYTQKSLHCKRGNALKSIFK